MKKRQGFVSNSSSSSFVLRGIKVTRQKFDEIFGENDIYEIIDKLEDEDDLSIIFNEDDCDSDLYIGKELASTYNKIVEEITIPTIEFDEEIKTKLEEKGFNDFELKLWVTGVTQ